MRTTTASGLAALLFAVSGIVVPPPLGAAPSRGEGWVITRTRPGAAKLEGTFTGTAESSTATAVLFALTGSGRHRTMSGAFTTTRIDWGSDGWPRVYGGLQPDCPAACGSFIDTPFTYGFSSNGHATDATVYVATWDVEKVTVKVTSPGWRVTRWAPAMRTVTTDRAGGVGARALHTSAGEFTGAAAAGGRYGSLGWVRLPCDTYGEGAARFTGGHREWSLACDDRLGALGWATASTHWRLTGSVTGVGGIVNVLVVVDFPR